MARRRQVERKVPTKAQMVKALADKWAFADLIGFHGGSKAFGECHRELSAWQDSDEREHRRQLILMPRGHLKTTISTVLDILWSLYVNRYSFSLVFTSGLLLCAFCFFDRQLLH